MTDRRSRAIFEEVDLRNPDRETVEEIQRILDGDQPARPQPEPVKHRWGLRIAFVVVMLIAFVYLTPPDIGGPAYLIAAAAVLYLRKAPKRFPHQWVRGTP